jgi:hypothetical protein
MRITGIYAAALLVAIGVAAPAAAHHSFATYDTSKIETIVGTVREFQWVNPHTWIYLSVQDGSGAMHDIGIEGNSIVNLKREGWSKETFKPGDKVTVNFHPHKDGTPGGAFRSAVTAAGKRIGNLETQLTTPTAHAPTGAAATPPK